MNIRKATKNDFDSIVRIALSAFSNDHKNEQQAKQWINANMAAEPRIQFFVAEKDQEILGYVNWMYIGGFQSGVVELDQIGVHESARGMGLGTTMVKESLELIKKYSEEELQRPLRVIKISTATTNKAKDFYKKNLNAKEVAVLKDLYYGEDEVILLSRI